MIKYNQITYEERRDLYLLMKRLELSNGEATDTDMLRLNKLFGLLNNDFVKSFSLKEMYEYLIEVNKVYQFKTAKIKRVKVIKQTGTTKHMTNGVYNDRIECCRCKEYKDLNNYYFLPSKNMIDTRCKTCISIYQKQKKIDKKFNKFGTNLEESCSICKVVKPIEMFLINKTGYYDTRCRECLTLYKKEIRSKTNIDITTINNLKTLHYENN